MAAYHPLLLTRLLLYAYCVGQPSSRRIERASYDEIPFRYLAANQHPDHDTIANFRRQHLPALAGLFVQALQLCRAAGLVRLGHVALDGTKLRAQASQRANRTHAQLTHEEAALARQVQQLLDKAEATDVAEDALYGAHRRGDELPDELATAAQRLYKLRAAQQKLEQQAREAAAQAERERAAAGGKARHEAEKKRWQRARRHAHAPAGAINLSDADSRLMKDGSTGSFVQGYNAQAAVDGTAQIVVAADVTPQPHDHAQLAPMVEQAQGNLERSAGVSDNPPTLPQTLSADAGYWSEESLAAVEARGIELLVAPGSTNARKQHEPLPANAPRSERARQMRARLGAPPGQAVYAQRKAIVEPVFAQIKERRGFRRFSLRGLEQVRAEWTLICLTHNLLKLHRATHRPSGTPTGPIRACWRPRPPRTAHGSLHRSPLRRHTTPLRTPSARRGSVHSDRLLMCPSGILLPFISDPPERFGYRTLIAGRLRVHPPVRRPRAQRIESEGAQHTGRSGTTQLCSSSSAKWVGA